MDLSQIICEFSRLLDGSYRPGLDPEVVLRRRLDKVCEEAGEVITALNGATAENPRKGLTHTMDEVRAELYDVAFAALGAVVHTLGNQGDVMVDFDAHARHVYSRLCKVVLEQELP